ncbi:MAG: acyltransferase [Verrucomicrobiota bacterium]
MSYYTAEELEKLKFNRLGCDVKISRKASIYNTDLISMGDFARVDDFCVLSGKISIGRNVHIAPHCIIAGGTEGVSIGDFSGFAYGVVVMSQTDDYSGKTLTNPTIPDEFKQETKIHTSIDKHVIVGTNSVILPGANLNEGVSVGALSLVTKATQPWTVYFGSPAKKIRSRSRDLLKLEEQYLKKQSS